MAQDLEIIFRELGVSQYLDAFVEQGFDCWETILDIQESDLDALGVKLGHRRKLQRRIANARGIAPSVSLASPVKPNVEEGKQDAPVRPEAPRPESSQEGTGVVKRKYRRHPKPDENAPERPPSAYVLFSNKMRDDLKSQNLTFTEIAKLVGENWQNLDPPEKEVYESQANAAKEKYHRDLADYKKTPEYRRYSQYLHDFKERQAKQNHAHDAAKRIKMEPGRARHGSSSSATPGGSTTTTGSGNGSGSEPPPTRQRRGNSTASLTDSHHSSNAPTPASHRNSIDEPGPSPRNAHFEVSSHRDSMPNHIRHQQAWRETSRSSDVSSTHLPSLSDMLDDKGMGINGSPGLDKNGSYSSGFVAANRRSVRNGPSPLLAGQIPLPNHVPHLRHEASSSGSNNSGSSSGSSFSRGPGEGPLPIHALLSGRNLPTASPQGYESPASSIAGTASPTDHGKPHTGVVNGPRGYGFQSASSAFQHMRAEQSGDGDVVMTMDDATPNSDIGSKERFEGMDALLRAGEIVSRHDRG